MGLLLRDERSWALRWRSATLLGMLRFVLSDESQLRLLEESDADELFALIDADRAYLSRWLPWATDQDLEGTLDFIRLTRRRLADNTGFTVAIVCDGALAGVVGLQPLDWTHRSTSVGYWLGERYQGRGIMTLAVRALIEHAVSIWKLNRIEIRAAVDNVRSRALPGRLGFREEGILRATERIGNVYLDSVVYSVLASEWPSKVAAAEHARGGAGPGAG
jgi:ribosomal-protein-serine acetyltransferase